LAAGPFLRCCSHCCCFIGLVVVVGACYGDALVVGGGNVNDENAACGGLEGDLAEGEGECGEEFLGVLVLLWLLVSQSGWVKWVEGGRDGGRLVGSGRRGGD
jgi:hypothetical protein